MYRTPLTRLKPPSPLIRVSVQHPLNVAVSNLLYRRFPIGRAVASAAALETAKRLRVGNPRYSRFGNLRYGAVATLNKYLIRLGGRGQGEGRRWTFDHRFILAIAPTFSLSYSVGQLLEIRIANSRPIPRRRSGQRPARVSILRIKCRGILLANCDPVKSQNQQ